MAQGREREEKEMPSTKLKETRDKAQWQGFSLAIGIKACPSSPGAGTFVLPFHGSPTLHPATTHIKMNNPPETPCFVDNAKAFQAGQISTEAYFGNMVEHFRGTRHHPGDIEKFDRALYKLDRIGDLVKACLWDSSFRPVKGRIWVIRFLPFSLVFNGSRF